MKTFFNELLNFQKIDDVEFLLLHVTPTNFEKEFIKQNLDSRYIKTKYIEIHHHEKLYATWNLGIGMARGKYIGIWNVDDIRTVEGLKEQIKLLDDSRDLSLIYGNFYQIENQVKDCTRPYHSISKNEKKQRFMEECHLTCFPLWRKDIHDQIGFFDEQFAIAGDFDFQVRVAQKYNLGSTSEYLGWYYTGDIKKLSSNWERLMTEQTVIGLRYKNFKLIHPFLIFSAIFKYNHEVLTFYNKKVSLNEFKESYYEILPLNTKYYFLISNFIKNFWIFFKKKLIKPCYFYAKNISFLFKKFPR